MAARLSTSLRTDSSGTPVRRLTLAAEKFDVRAYGKHVLRDGAREEKREMLDKLKSNFILKDGRVTLA